MTLGTLVGITNGLIIQMTTTITRELIILEDMKNNGKEGGLNDYAIYLWMAY
jgi:hypothetical protein